MPPRLRASITVWGILIWTFLILPMMALTIELPQLLSARITMVHAARAAVQAAYQGCTDFTHYQTADAPRQSSLDCVEREADELFTLYLQSQGLPFTRAATLQVTTDPLSVSAHQMRACIEYIPRMMPDLAIPNPICVVEQAHFEFRYG